MKTKVTKAVFPVAGIGSRFLPATKATPKEMLPIVDKPLIQYAVEEAIACGITDLIFVTNGNKRAIEDHFDTNYELEEILAVKGQSEMLESIRSIHPEGVNCYYVRQSAPLGLGHAILCARAFIQDEPFAVILPDDLIDAPEQNCLSQMLEVYDQYHHSIAAVQRVPKSETHRYGIVQVEAKTSAVNLMKDIIEKPKANPPSNLAVVGRYILNSTIFAHLATTPCGAGGEIQLTDGLRKLLKDESINTYEFTGERYDCGTKMGFQEANMAFAMKHSEIGNEFKHFMQTYMNKYMQTA